jgi:hypothetical protein
MFFIVYCQFVMQFLLKIIFFIRLKKRFSILLFKVYRLSFKQTSQNCIILYN